jgi:ABC-type multidrug transport system fused ATPase/permease subunit
LDFVTTAPDDIITNGDNLNCSYENFSLCSNFFLIQGFNGAINGNIQFTVLSSIGFIYSENWKVGGLVTFAMILIVVAGMVYYKKIQQSIRVRNNHNEKKTNSLEEGYEQSISFFKRMRKLDIYNSTIQGKNWFLIGLIKNIFLFISIILLVLTAKDITIGSIITVYSYVNNFLISLLSVPVAIEMYTRLSDVLKRIG